VDPNAPTGFVGLPEGWAEQLKTAKFTKEEITDDGDAILDVLRFHMEQVGGHAMFPSLCMCACVRACVFARE
jgi:hypothetical protein